MGRGARKEAEVSGQQKIINRRDHREGKKRISRRQPQTAADVTVLISNDRLKPQWEVPDAKNE